MVGKTVLLVKGKLVEYVGKKAKDLASIAKTTTSTPVSKTSVVYPMRIKTLSTDTVELSSKATPFLMSENLIARTTPRQREILKDLYQNKFLVLAKNKVKHPASPILEKGTLLHGENYDPTVIDSILKDGLVSIDLGKVLRKTENSQTTIGGIDTWLNDKTRSIDEYFNKWLATPPEYATTNFQKLNRQQCWRGENKWIDLGDKCGRKVVFVINPIRNKELQEITKYSVTPKTKGLSTTIMGGNMTNQAKNCMYETPDFCRHTFVPVGIPSNYFEKIIVGKKINDTQIAEIKKMIAKYGLDTKVYDIKGNIL